MTSPDERADAVAHATRNAANSVTLARAILGDAELGRILSKYRGRPNTAEIRRLMVEEVSAALQAHTRTALAGGVPAHVRPYDTRTWRGKRHDAFAAVLEYGPGGFMFDDAGDLIIHTPDGSLITWNITRPDVEPFWHWDGNRERPTLTPPMCITEDLTAHGKGIVELWQGRMLAGDLVPA